ncbi:hypothetical protein D3C72_2346610 [compost metagenome]
MVDAQIQQISHEGLELFEKPDIAAALGGEYMLLVVDIHLDGPAPRLPHDVRCVYTP